MDTIWYNLNIQTINNTVIERLEKGLNMELKRFEQFRSEVLKSVGEVIVGKEKEIELIMVGFLSEGHMLIEDMPGTGKTMMVKAFSKTLNLPFKRIQFTPDLLPSDITGINFYNQKALNFEFREGPIFGNIVLTDEINRATPRTQSALLEAMGERQITADGETRMLRRPFMVLATQNPIESYGTFPLPEAQLDRFFMRIKFGFPTVAEEKTIIMRNVLDPLDRIQNTLKLEDITYLIQTVKNVKITEDVMDYLVNIVHATRNKEEVILEVSPRGSIALFKACQAYAAINGRDYIMPEDVKYMAPFILNHRIAVRGVNTLEGSIAYVKTMLEEIPVPIEG